MNNSLKIGIYSPYLHISGGGERYLLTIASFFSRDNSVDLFSDKESLQKAITQLSISLEQTNIIATKELLNLSMLSRIKFTKKYDLFFFMTDGSLFFSGARKNFLIVQSPAHLPKSTFINSLKLSNWSIICYSHFMQQIILNRLGKESISLFAPVDVEDLKSHLYVKNKKILSVGRFFEGLHTKRHDILVKSFVDNYKAYFKDWELHIAGGLTEESGNKSIEKLKKLSKGYPVYIHKNISYKDLKKLYGESQYYWHAAGFGEDEDHHPERMEHFGITTIEAMSCGTIPIVYNGGGQKDIVQHNVNGFLWKSTDELIDFTVGLIKDSSLRDKILNNCKSRATDFSVEKFYEYLKKITQN